MRGLRACASRSTCRVASWPTVRFVGLVERILAEEGTAPEFLEFEITESSLIADGPEVAETLQRIRALGVSLSIDDFGTGYSSLGRLVSLPFDVLKIDRCFVAEIGSSSQSEAIVSAIVAMGHQLGLRIVAEGDRDGRAGGEARGAGL